MDNALKSVEFHYNPYKEEPSENQMIFSKMLKIPPVKIENLKLASGAK